MGKQTKRSGRAAAGKRDSKDLERRRNTSLRLPAQTLKALKIRALEEDTSVQNLLETLVEDYLGNKRRRR